MLGIDAMHMRLCDLKLRRLERFVYEYDFGDSWIHDLRLEATLPIRPGKVYPMCVAGKCSAPPEDCGGPHAFTANRQYYAGFGRVPSDEDLLIAAPFVSIVKATFPPDVQIHLSAIAVDGVIFHLP